MYKICSICESEAELMVDLVNDIVASSQWFL